MKKILVACMFGLLSITAFAEATFDQVEGLIQQQNYSAAAAGLEVIIQNHPKSAKAFYAMAQAQAGLGNQEKALKALNIATGLNPTLDFAPASSVQSLKEAITPQTKKIEAIEETHHFRNFVLFAMFAGFAVAMYFLYSVYARKQEEEEAARKAEYDAAEAKVKRMQAEREAEEAQAAKEIAEHNAKQDALKAHKNYGHERFDPANPDKLKSVKQFKEEKLAEAMVAQARAEAAEAKARADAAEASARMYRTSAQTFSQPTHTTVVNNSNDGLVTGILLGEMMSNHNHTNNTTIIERDVYVAPAVAPRSSWDDAPSPSSSRSSSWDDDSSSSSKSSSSWSSSSSDSSSSWSDSSSSSDSGSSSSWD